MVKAGIQNYQVREEGHGRQKKQCRMEVNTMDFRNDFTFTAEDGDHDGGDADEDNGGDDETY